MNEAKARVVELVQARTLEIDTPDACPVFSAICEELAADPAALIAFAAVETNLVLLLLRMVSELAGTEVEELTSRAMSAWQRLGNKEPHL
jgi:hypothetical protein